MEENNTRPVNPRRRKRSKMRDFKEVYLPVIIVGLTLILILTFVIGSIVRAVQSGKVKKQASIDASIFQEEEEDRLAQECQQLLVHAEALANAYDYEGAIAVLESFTGNINSYPELSSQRDTYVSAMRSMVAWEDPNQIMNLSFQLLIADPARAFSNAIYSSSFKNNFITTGEFSKILQQLYENGYILVSLDDFTEARIAEDGTTVYAPKTLYLPNGKKPLMLTQTNVNYNLYLIDSDQDMLPDKNGGGFASKLLVDSNGFFSSEMVDSKGETVTGAFDMVPILEEFIAKHPDFSYKGARAVLALTGYNGLFGYRTHPEGQKKFGEDAYNQALADVEKVANSLISSGYTLACYTYENIGYGKSGLTEVQADLAAWNEQVVPILGNLDILVFAQNSDLTTEAEYSGDKFNATQAAGFRYYLGFCDEGKQNVLIKDGYIRQGRILVSGKNMDDHADWFAPYFDASLVRDEARGI